MTRSLPPLGITLLVVACHALADPNRSDQYPCWSSLDCPQAGHSCVNGLCSCTAQDCAGAGTDRVSLEGWRVENVEGGQVQSAAFPTGFSVPAGTVVLLVRNADRDAFSRHWGVNLSDRVTVWRTNALQNGVPIINGGEAFAVYDASGQRRDGLTFRGGVGRSYRRRATADPHLGSSWVEGGPSTATPGAVDLRPSDRGVYVSEWSDATDANFQFLELYVNP